MSYQSPFSTRYGSQEMRELWSENTKRLTWRRIWVAVAQAQAEAGLLGAEDVEQIQDHATEINLARALQIEGEIAHDLMAELKCFSEQCGPAGGRLHWGLTSADVEDNADVVRQRAALDLLLARLRSLLLRLAERIEDTADFPVLAYTHLQPAAPTTLGYRLASYGQDILHHWESLRALRESLHGKGIRGPVGTAASLVEILAGTHTTQQMLEASVMQSLGLEAHPITTQTYPRIQDYQLLSALAGLAATLHKFAFDMRLMQSPGFRTAAEPFQEKQVGSSAMPFKQNPILAEKICSLARLLQAHANVSWQNAADALLERTLDDSANRRSIIPEAFLALDEMLLVAARIIDGLAVQPQGSADALQRYGPFLATERLLTALVKAGADRQEMHERLRMHSLIAWEAVEQSRPNPLIKRITADASILRYFPPARIAQLLDATEALGLAPQRSRELATRIRQGLTDKVAHDSTPPDRS
jgi:adenylosuccinate lyase